MSFSLSFSRCRQCEKEFYRPFLYHWPIEKCRKDKFTIHSKAVVCQDVELKGDITIGAGNIIPRLSYSMWMLIWWCGYRNCSPSQGNDICYSWTHCYWTRMYHRGGCYYCEQASGLLQHQSLYDKLANRRKEVMRIGDDNLFEIGCREFRIWQLDVAQM